MIKTIQIVSFNALILIFSTTSFSQSSVCSIEGRVIDKSTGEPLVLANVYLSETTFGAATNNEGFFEINNIPRSSYSLIVSMIGYEHQVIKITLNHSEKRKVDVALSPKSYELGEIAVKGKIDSDWKNQLDRFKEYFFGKNDFARECKILNETIINFSEDAEKFSAEANEPLIVVNNALGYKIEVILKNFSYIKRTKTISFLLYPKFTEIDTLKDILEDEYIPNRKKAYFGSTMELFSLLAKGKYDFVEAGFRLYTTDSRDQVFNSHELVSFDEKTERYLLFKSLVIVYWKDGIVKKSNLDLLNRLGLEFDSGGYLLSQDYLLRGDLSNEGVALMLPRFYVPVIEQ